MRDDRSRLQDILDAIKRIERYAKRGRRVFEVERDLPILKKQVSRMLTPVTRRSPKH